METKFQLKCHLQNGSDPLTVAGLELAGCCSAVTLIYVCRRHCVCAFPLVYFYVPIYTIKAVPSGFFP